MPQLDSLSFFSQVSWFIFIFLFLYFFTVTYTLPSLLRILKSRKWLLSGNTKSIVNFNFINNFSIKGDKNLIKAYEVFDEKIENIKISFIERITVRLVRLGNFLLKKQGTKKYLLSILATDSIISLSNKFSVKDQILKKI